MRKTKLEIYHFWTSYEQFPIDMFLDKFEKNFSIRVQRNALEWGFYLITTKAKMVKGEPPDIMVCDIGEKMSEHVKAGELSDISHIWKEEGFSGVFSDWLEKASSLNGKFYGVPSKCFTFAVWYLPNVFQKYKIEPPETWEEFLYLCEKFKRVGVPPLASSWWEVSLWFENILARVVGPRFYYRLMKGEESWTDPKVIDAYEIFRELRKYFLPSPFSYSARDSWMKLNNHEVAMQLQGDWVNGIWRHGYKYHPGKDFNYFLIPPLDKKIGQVMVVGGNLWVMPALAKHPEEAMTFLRYAGSKEAQMTLAEGGVGIVGRTDIPDECYDPISLKLIKDLRENEIVPRMESLLPPQVASVERLQQMQIFLHPKLSRRGIRKLASEVQILAQK